MTGTSDRREEKEPRVWMKPSLETCTVEVLKKSGEPMYHGDILEEVKRMRPIGGRAPGNTLYGVLYKNAKVRLVGDGYFAVKEQSVGNESQEKKVG